MPADQNKRPEDTGERGGETIHPDAPSVSADGAGDAGDFFRETAPTLQISGYEVVRELGRGGQAVVYQAVQKSTHRKVAVKVLIEGPYASKSAKRRFERRST